MSNLENNKQMNIENLDRLDIDNYQELSADEQGVLIELVRLGVDPDYIKILIHHFTVKANAIGYITGDNGQNFYKPTLTSRMAKNKE